MIALADVLAKLKKVRASGRGYTAACPAHDDHEPSLSVTIGTTGAVLMKCHGGCEFSAIVAALGVQAHDLLPDRDPDFRSAPRTSPARKVTATHVYRNADGSIVARKLRLVDAAGGKSFRWERPDADRPDAWITGGNSAAPLYRLPELVNAPADVLVIIVEGEKDADRMASLGYVATTTPNGASAKWREADSQFLAGRRVCVIADDDEAGRQKANDTATALASGIAAAVGVVKMPNADAIKGFDVSDFLDHGGSENALRAIVEGFDTPRLPAEVAAPEVIDERVLAMWRRGGPEPGIYPGWPTLAKLYRPKLGQLSIWTGSPNAGKSTLLDDLIIRTSCTDDDGFSEGCARWRWVIFSAEQYPVERHVSMLTQKLIAKPFGDGPTTRMTEGELRAALKVLREYVTILDPAFSSLHVDRILEIAAELNTRQKRHALLIDPFNVLAATSRAKGESEHDFVNTFLAKLRTFAQAEQMAVFVVAHPTKLKREEGADEYPVVRPWDISGSAHWYNHADSIVSVWRAMKDEDRVTNGEVEVHVSKVRFQPECGTLGMAKLYFDCATTRYSDAPVEVTRTVTRLNHDAKLYAAEGRS